MGAQPNRQIFGARSIAVLDAICEEWRMRMSDYDCSFSNPGPEKLVLWLEPWAEQFEVPARSTVALKGAGGSEKGSVGEIEWGTDCLVIWANVTTLEVFIDDVLQDSASVPLPDGLSKEMLTVLFAAHPSARLGGKAEIADTQSKWWKRLWLGSRKILGPLLTHPSS